MRVVAGAGENSVQKVALRTHLLVAMVASPQDRGHMRELRITLLRVQQTLELVEAREPQEAQELS
jgi:hypothetical protein